MRLANRLLLGLEIGLLLGLAVTVIYLSRAWARTNEESAVAKYAAPTPSPTALHRMAELPQGSLPTPGPTLLPLGQESTPGHLHPIVPGPRLEAPPTSEAAPQAAVRIVIPAIGVDAPVVHGVDAESLKRGVGHYEGAVNPGERGNLVLAGHNDAYGEVFRSLSDLGAGDEVTVFTRAAKYRYVIRGWRLVEPDEVSVLEPTRNPTITLISCYPYRIDTQRIVVLGDLVEG